MKVLVTGGTGFVGSNLIKSLVAGGHEITIIGCKTENGVPKGVNRVLQLNLEGIDWSAVYGHDICFHQAANNDTLDNDEKEMWRANVYGPIKLFTEMFKGGCKKFVYASSTAVYGDSPAPYVVGKTEEKPLNAYGRSKLAFDEFAMKFAKENNVDVVGLRYCNIYGPGEQHKGHRRSMISQIIGQMQSGQPRLFKYGKQSRDWVYVKDVVEANLAAARYKGSGIFNVGTGKATSFNKLVKYIFEAGALDGSPYPEDRRNPIFIDNPNPAAYQNYTRCHIGKTKKELGWKPKFLVKEGIKDFVMEIRNCTSSQNQQA